MPRQLNLEISDQQWLESETGHRFNYKTVHKTVRYRLGAKLKVPRPRNAKRDEPAVEQFKKHRDCRQGTANSFW